MTERSVTGLRFFVGQYADLPIPANLREAWIIQEFVDGLADPDEAIKAIETEIGSEPFTLNERWSYTSWGAEGSTLDIVLGVSTAFGGIAGIVYLLEKLANGLRNPNAGATIWDAETAGSTSRQNLAVFLNRSESEIQVMNVKETMGRFEISLKAPEGMFVMTIAGGKPHRLQKK